MKPGATRLSALALAVPRGRASWPGARQAAGRRQRRRRPATGATIERTYTLLAGSPYQVTVGSAAATTLYDSMQNLPPDNGRPRVSRRRGRPLHDHDQRRVRRSLEKATAIIGGCRVVLIGGHSYGGGTQPANQFWTTC